MRWKQPLDEILGSRARLRVLRSLWEEPAPLSGREIARRAGVSHTGALKALEELMAADVVWPASDPTGLRYRINRSHELVRRGLAPLFKLERSLERSLADAIASKVPDAVSIVLFGSTARGEDEPSSDLDLLIVVRDGQDPDEVLDDVIEENLYGRFGKIVTPIVWTQTMLLERASRRLPLIDSILRDGRVLAGAPLSDLLSREGRRVAG